jgi:hypothetical protein
MSGVDVDGELGSRGELVVAPGGVQIGRSEVVDADLVPCQNSCTVVDLGVYPRRSCPSDSCIDLCPADRLVDVARSERGVQGPESPGESSTISFGTAHASAIAQVEHQVAGLLSDPAGRVPLGDGLFRDIRANNEQPRPSGTGRTWSRAVMACGCIQGIGSIRRRPALGGLINRYHCAA